MEIQRPLSLSYSRQWWRENKGKKAKDKINWEDMIYKCQVCKKMKVIKSSNRGFICRKCYEHVCLYNAALEGFRWWKESLVNNNVYQSVIDKVIIKKIKKDLKSKSIEEQKQEVVRSLEEEIKSRLQFYHKDEVFVALLAIKESVRRTLLRDDKTPWLIIGDITTVNWLMKFANDMSYFENHAMDELENECSNFANAICFARRYALIVDNIEIDSKNTKSIEEICYKPIQSEETEKYFEIYLKNGFGEKPEDYKIKNPILNKKLEEENKTPDKIIEGLNGLLKKEFGFERKDYQILRYDLLKMEFPEEQNYWEWKNGKLPIFEECPVFIMEKSLLQDLCEDAVLEKILQTFSINRNINVHTNEKELELYCFYETRNFFVFGNFDLSQVITIFESFLISGHYIDAYKQGLSEKREVREAQKTLSKYFSACVSDWLLICGYRLPMQKYMKEYIPIAEIDKIKVNRKNILLNELNQRLGDIDVLAINETRKEILLFELKFFKPAISVEDMLSRDKSQMEDNEVIRHMQERESAISANTDEVVKFVLGKEQTGYTVKSILLTSRTNFYAIQEEKIKCLTWAEFLEQVKKKEL